MCTDLHLVFTRLHRVQQKFAAFRVHYNKLLSIFILYFTFILNTNFILLLFSLIIKTPQSVFKTGVIKIFKQKDLKNL